MLVRHHVKEKQNVIEFDLRSVSAKKHRNKKELVFRLKALFLLKKHILPFLCSNSNFVFVFWRCSKTLIKFCKCQNWNSLFREISFLELPKYSGNLQMVSTIEKLKNWKIYLKNSWKIDMLFGKRIWKIGMPLARWHVY